MYENKKAGVRRFFQNALESEEQMTRLGILLTSVF